MNIDNKTAFTAKSVKAIVLTGVIAVASATASMASASDLTDAARLREVADSLHNSGRTDSAAIVGAQAIELAHASGNAPMIVGAHSAQGVFLRSLGRIDEALANYEAALEIVTTEEFRANPDEEAIEETATFYVNLAVLELDLQHKEEAAKNAVQAGEWIGRSDDAGMKCSIYGVVGSVLTACGDLDKALEYQNLAYDNALESGNRDGAFRAAVYTMLISDRTGKKEEAEEWREKCREMLGEIVSTMSKLLYYQAECSICLKNDDSRGAVQWFDKILSMDGIDNMPFVKYDCYNNMHVA